MVKLELGDYMIEVRKLTFTVYMKYAYKEMSSVKENWHEAHFGGAIPPEAKLGMCCQEVVERLLDCPYRKGKRLLVLPGEGTFSRMPYGSRGHVFDEEQSVATSLDGLCWDNQGRAYKNALNVIALGILECRVSACD
jgi:hypothetical protein